jgi:hypothetical protein
MTQAQAFAEMVRRANLGNEACLQQLRVMLDERPEIWMTVGDAGKLAERAWFTLLAARNALVEQSMPRRHKELKAELAGPSPSPLEKVLVDLIGLRWLAVQQAEIDAAEASADLKLANFRLKRAESAQKRFASSVKLLQLVRSTVSPSPCPMPTTLR